MKKSVRRLIALLVCVMMLAGLAAQAFADGIQDEAVVYSRAREILDAHEKNPDDGLSEYELQQWQLIADTVIGRMIELAVAVRNNRMDKQDAADKLAQYEETRAADYAAAQKAEFWRERDASNQYKKYWDEQYNAARDGHVSREIEFAKGRETLYNQEQAAIAALEQQEENNAAQLQEAQQKLVQMEQDARDALAAYEESMYNLINGNIA